MRKLSKKCSKFREKKWRIISGLLIAGGLKDFHQISLLISPPSLDKKNNFAILISFFESRTANPALNFFNIEVNYERLLLRRVWM